MFTYECGLDHIFNDFATFCWYRGCWPMQFLFESGDKFLYILRAINNAAIVWKEGIQQFSKEQDMPYEDQHKEWAKLSAQTGQTLSDIF